MNLDMVCEALKAEVKSAQAKAETLHAEAQRLRQRAGELSCQAGDADREAGDMAGAIACLYTWGEKALPALEKLYPAVFKKIQELNESK